MALEELSDSDSGLSAEAFSAAMARFQIEKGARIAAAASGGADSMALTLLLSAWAANHGVCLYALTVDHRLRDDSAAEAAQVGKWLGAKNVSHLILNWEGGVHARSVETSPQSAAREARYRLMGQWCKANNCSHLFVAHHADDQVETFLMRLARGSGVEGLAAMPPVVEREGVQISRPLLDFTKTQLIGVCRAQKQSWIEDPSNENERSTRVRFRQAQEILEREGLTRHRLLETVGHMRRAKEAIDRVVTQLVECNYTLDQFGVGRVSVQAFRETSEEVGLRALSRILSAVSGSAYGPRFDGLERLFSRIVGEPWRDATLHGCAIVREGSDLAIHREAAQVSGDQNMTMYESVVWDGRFRITLGISEKNLPEKNFILSRLTTATWQALRREKPSSSLEGVPFRVRETLPVIFDSVGLASVPHANYVREDLRNFMSPHVDLAQFFPSSQPIQGKAAKMLH